MKKYEIMYILKADLDDATRIAEIEKIHGILTSKRWLWLNRIGILSIDTKIGSSSL